MIFFRRIIFQWVKYWPKISNDVKTGLLSITYFSIFLFFYFILTKNKYKNEINTQKAVDLPLKAQFPRRCDWPARWREHSREVPNNSEWKFRTNFVKSFIPSSDMISDMHAETARLQEANDKVLTELRHVEFENSFSSAMMIQNMKSFQDRR